MKLIRRKTPAHEVDDWLMERFHCKNRPCSLSYLRSAGLPSDSIPHSEAAIVRGIKRLKAAGLCRGSYVTGWERNP